MSQTASIPTRLVSENSEHLLEEYKNTSFRPVHYHSIDHPTLAAQLVCECFLMTSPEHLHSFNTAQSDTDRVYELAWACLRDTHHANVQRISAQVLLHNLSVPHFYWLAVQDFVALMETHRRLVCLFNRMNNIPSSDAATLLAELDLRLNLLKDPSLSMPL